MKNFKKRLIALVSLTCVAFSAFTGCSENENSESSKSSNSQSSNSEVSEEPMTAMPFQWGSESDNITIDGVDINEDDPVKADRVDTTTSDDDSDADSEETATGYVAGEPVTEIVTVTEANGEVATEADGQVVTEVKTITNATPEPTTADATTEYISNTKGMYAMWIDISKNEDFVFDGSVIKVTFKVKDTAPDGVYNISINPDLSSIEGVTINPDTIVNGSITVGDGSVAAADTSSMNGFAVYGDNVSAKQGDTIEFSINMKENPGLAAFCIWYYYDSNAFEIIDCTPDGEFSEVSKNSTQTGENS